MLRTTAYENLYETVFAGGEEAAAALRDDLFLPKSKSTSPRRQPRDCTTLREKQIIPKCYSCSFRAAKQKLVEERVEFKLLYVYNFIDLLILIDLLNNLPT